MAAVTITMSGDDARLRAAHERLLRDQQKLLDKYSQAEKASKQAGETEAQAKAKGEAATKRYLTTLEKLKIDLNEVRRLNEKGVVSEETLARAKAKVTDEQKRLNSESRKMSGTIDSLKSVTAQYIGIQAAMTVLNGLASEYDAIQGATLEKTKQIALAQQETIKNLEGMTVLQKEELLTTTVTELQNKTGFAGRSQITSAIGAGISAGGSVDEVKSAVDVAARLNKQTPGNLVASASALVDLGRATGIKDAEKNQAFLLKVGAVSRTEDPAALSRSLSESLGSVMKTTPNANPEMAAREAGALYATLNQESNDVTGRSTATASIQFAAYLRKFFEQGGEDPDAVKTRQEQIAKLEAKEAAKGKTKANKGLSEIEKKKLADLKSEGEVYKGFTDPGTLSGRIQVLQQNKEIQKAFLDKMPGEAAFKLPMEKLLEKGASVFDRFNEAFKSITFDPQATKDAIKQAEKLTPTLDMANAGVQAQANLENFDVSKNAQAFAEIGKIAKDTLPRVRSGGISGAVQFAVENVSGPLRQGMGGSAQSFAQYTTEQLIGRRSVLEQGGISPSEQARFDLINGQIKAIERIVERLNQEEAKQSLKETAAATQKAAAALQASASKTQANAARAQASMAGQ